MSGPPSSPPMRISSEQERQLRTALLPAFGSESSPSSSFKQRQFLKPKYDVFRDSSNSASAQKAGFLPTPIPTSEANLQMSSPPPSSPQMLSGPLIQSLEDRTISQSVDETVGASSVDQMIIVRVPTSGEKVTVGRSSKSSTFALSASNRLASRVHACLSFDASKNILMIECLGWNGLIVNVPQTNGNDGPCNKTYDVVRGQILNIEGADSVTMNVHGDRALIEVINDSHISDITEDEAWSLMASSSPLRRKRQYEEKENLLDEEVNKKRALDEVVLPEQNVKTSTAVPEINVQKPDISAVPALEGNTHAIKEEPLDNNTKKDVEPKPEPKLDSSSEVPKALDTHDEGDMPDDKNADNVNADRSRSSSPFPGTVGDDSEGQAARKSRRQQEHISDTQRAELENVIINLIAFSRSSATPLNSVRKANSTLQSFHKSLVMAIIKRIDCIGIIEGAIEDTTARKADDEYYYIPDKDTNEERRRAVQGTKGHRSLRNCRKTSKQYYYRPLQLD